MATLTDHHRFRQHVAFDNVPLGEPTKSNTISLTLNTRHRGYQRKKRSRTFMVGVDENAYSDYALEWLLDELVEDGDEIVCVTVVEKESRGPETYQSEAKTLMDSIKKKNGTNRAVSIVLEYAVGKLHATFQRFVCLFESSVSLRECLGANHCALPQIQMYEPAMLTVGTRGRSLGGIQGLVGSRNSFSKYCLQYCPVPVVVVRPTEKREKKKSKRMNDEGRQAYAKMFPSGKHEVDSETSSMYELEVQLPQDQEAHEIARALGLPASFDPTIKPINPRSLLSPRQSSPSIRPAARATAQVSSDEPGRVIADESSDDDEEEDDGEGEFETFSGQQALASDKKDKLHRMEMSEASALIKQNKNGPGSGVVDDSDSDDEKPALTTAAK
jgi:nucleotide-binding universal stress UspA family protein